MKDDFDLTDDEKRAITESIKSRPLTFHRSINQSINDTTGTIELPKTQIALATNQQSLLTAILAYHWCAAMHQKSIDVSIAVVDDASAELNEQQRSQLDSLQLDIDYQSIQQSIQRLTNQITAFTVISVNKSISSLPSSLNHESKQLKFVPASIDTNQPIDQVNESVRQFIADLPDLLALL